MHSWSADLWLWHGVCQQTACRLSAKESLTPVICSLVNDTKPWYWMSSLSAQTLSHSKVRVVTDLLQLSSWKCGHYWQLCRWYSTSEISGFHSVDVEVSGLARSLRCVAGVTYTDVSGELSIFFFKKWGVRVGCVSRVSRGACCLHLQGRNMVSHIDSCPSRFTKRRVYCLVRDIGIGTCEPLTYLPHFDPESGSVVFFWHIWSTFHSRLCKNPHVCQRPTVKAQNLLM